MLRGVGWVSGDYRGLSSDIAVGRRVTQHGRYTLFVGDQTWVIPFGNMGIAR